MRHVSVSSLCEALIRPSENGMSSENLTDQFASAVMTGSIHEADIAQAGANGACDAKRAIRRGLIVWS